LFVVVDLKKVNVTTPMKYKLIKAASMERKVNQKAPMKYKSTKQH
jgi:hypothetical protein